MNTIESLIEISQSVAKNYDEIQGGGGNTSVKLDDQLMAIKASGFELGQVNKDSGYVIVNYQNIRNFLNTSSAIKDADYVKILESESQGKLRPSMETGFHVMLGNLVLHTHSSYTNLLSCSKEGEQLAQEIFSGTDILWIPYANPGLTLSLLIKEKISEYFSKYSKLPQIIFLENHGLIISGSTAEECISLNQTINSKIQAHFAKLPEFPKYQELSEGTGYFSSNSEYLLNYLKRSFNEIFKQVLFPDQVVYIRKEKLELVNNEIRYLTSYKEAKTIEETLLSYVFLIESFDKLNLNPKYLSIETIEYLDNVETEKYRRSILKNQ